MIKKHHSIFFAFFIVISLLMLTYLLYHILNGPTSYSNMNVKKQHLQVLKSEYEILQEEQDMLIDRNQALKEETLDLDLLEELARQNGYGYPDETVIPNQ